MEKSTSNESEPVVSQLIQEAICTSAYESQARWKSGREARLIEARGTGSDSLEIISPGGELELTVRFTPEGAKIVVPGGRLNLIADEISVQTEKMKLKVEQDVEWEVGGQFKVHSGKTQLKSEKDITINGRFLKLNCDESGEVNDNQPKDDVKLIDNENRNN